MTSIRLLDQNRTLLGMLDASSWSFSRKIGEVTEITVTIPRTIVHTGNTAELFAFLSPVQSIEEESPATPAPKPTQELAYFIEIYTTRRLITGIISKREFTDTNVTLKAKTEESLLTMSTCPAQYGRVYEHYDIQDVANDMARSWLVQRIKAKAQWDEGAPVNVDTTTEPGVVLLSKDGAYAATGSITLTFARPSGWDRWERIRWSGDYDGAVTTKMQYSTDGGSTWSPEYVGGEPDTLGVEIAATDATTVMVRMILATTDTTSEDANGDPVGVTPRLFALEVISRSAPAFTVSSVSGDEVAGIEADKITPLEILQAVCEQAGHEFYFDDGTLYVGKMGVDNTDGVFLRKGTNMVVTQLGDELAEVYNVIHAIGSGSGINRLEVTRSDATSIAAYGRRERYEEFDTTDLAELTAFAEEYLSTHKDPFYAWKVRASYPPDEEPVYGCGDTVTVSDGTIVTTARIEQIDRQHSGGVLLFLNKTRADLVTRVRPTYTNLTAFDRPVALSVFPTINGLVASVSRPVDISRWDYTELHLSLTPDFTPAPETIQSEKRATVFEIMDLTVGTRYYLRAVHVAHDGTRSEPSDERSGVPVAVDIGDTTIRGNIVLHKMPDNIIVTARGQLRTEQIVFTAELQNLELGTLIWERSDGGPLELFEIDEGIYDPYSRVLDASTVETDTVTVGVQMDVGVETYSATSTVSKISEGIPYPISLGAVTEIPTETQDGQPLMFDDHFTWDAEEQGIFKWGYSYAYRGKDALGDDIWVETESFTHLSNLAKENIEISKREGVITHSRVVFSEYIYATKIEVMDELVANFKEYEAADVGKTIDGHLVTADDVGKIYRGSRIGADGKIRAIYSEFWETVLHGIIKSDALDTQEEDTNTTPVAATSAPTNLWNEKRLYDLFPVSSSQYLQAAEFDWGGESYTKATKVNNQKIIYDRITGPTNGVWGTGGISQIGGDYTIPADIPSTEFEVEVDWGWKTFVILANSYLEVWRGGVKISTIKRSSNSQKKVTLVNMLPGDVIKCFVEWGIGYIELTRRYIEVRTRSAFTGIVGLRSNNHLYAIPISQDVNKWHSYVWSGAGVSTDDILDKASGTPIVEACANVGTDYVQCSGTIDYDGDQYNVDRVRRVGGTVYFYSASKLIQIDSFVDGTPIGTYEPPLEISELIVYSQLPAALVRYLIPKAHGEYDLGQSGVVTPSGLVDRYFRNLYLTGTANVDKINTGLGDTDVYPMNQSVATTASPTFNALTVASINTGHGVTEVYKETYELCTFSGQATSVTLSAMEIGETKRVVMQILNADGNVRNLVAPAGTLYAINNSINPVAGGGTLYSRGPSVNVRYAFTVWRIS